MAALLAVLAACTSSQSHARPTPSGHPATPGGASVVLKREGLVLPSTYRQACAAEVQAFACLHVPAGPIPAALNHRLHFPVLRAGQRCPVSPGTPLNTVEFGGIARGSGPVEVLAGDRRGIADLINPSSAPPWLAVKTLWFSKPAYHGPFVIRAKRLAGPGPVALGEGPVVGPLVVPPGPTLNSFGDGYRTVPGGLFVRTPGCYAWQVDGLGFSEIIVVRTVLHKNRGLAG